MRFENFFFALSLAWAMAACTSQPLSTPSFSQVDVGPAQTDAEQISPVWTSHVSAAVNTSPLLSDNLVIFPTADGQISVLNSDSGDPAWQYSGQTVWDTSVNADAERVCAGVKGGKIVCLNALTGEELWTIEIGIETQSKIAMTKEVLYIPTTWAGSGLDADYSAPAELVALNASTGEILWRSVTENYILRRPVVNGGLVITGGAYQPANLPAGEVATRIYAFNLSDGDLAWTYESKDGLVRWVDSAGDIVIFSGATETVHALDLQDGHLIWDFGPGYWMQFPLIDNGRIFLGTGDEIFHAINASTGIEDWSHNINPASLNQVGRPSLLDGILWFNAITGEIYAVDVEGGKRAAYFATGFSVRVGGVVYQSYYIMGDADGNVHAYKVIE
ncbi:MAG TPA: PQQ-binding-like beta-propeller repeat protein [Anaerolineales bacterium]|nr:PQQ-binding-like beta-propeller repeat protein [Anaerolineales bacterium]